MTVADAEDQLEKEQAEQFIAELPMFEGVESTRVDLANDHTGDPAMWLVFRLLPGVEFDMEMARQFNRYAAEIQTKILHSGLKRFPYTRLE